MGEYSVALPTALWLPADDFSLHLGGQDIRIRHDVVEQEQLDPRLGSVAGSFGFERDPLGLLRYSRLRFTLDAATERALLAVCFGDRFSTWAMPYRQRRVNLAAAVCGVFVDRYRAFRRDDTIEPLHHDSLAHLEYADDAVLDEIRLYGGAITLAPAGLSAPALHAFKAALTSGPEPPAWRLAVLDAMRTAKRGFPAPALIGVLGALETAFNGYFAGTWRGPTRTSVQAAADELRLAGRKRIKTIEDVLREGDLRRKIEAFARRHALDPRWEQGVLLALDARNDAVHGGVTLPAPIALRHIRTIGNFLEEHQNVLPATVPAMRPRLLHAFEEATGTTAPDGLARVFDDFLAPHGLDLIVYCDSPTHPKGPVADAYERTLVVWLPLHDARTTPDQLSLTLARLALAFSLRYQGRLLRARVGELPFDDPGGGFSAVASALTNAVWEIGIDRVLETYGTTDAIRDDLQHRRERVRQKFGQPYDSPPVLSVVGFTAHVELARVAAVLSQPRRHRLLTQIAANAPEVAQRARSCVDVLAAVNLEEPATIRDALICLHDQSPMLLASVVVAEPETGRLFGDGVFKSRAQARSPNA